MNTTGRVVLEVDHLVKHFPIRRTRDVVHAVNDVSFSIRTGETLALVGESGSGKTTVGRCVLKLIEPTAGRIMFAGHDLAAMKANQMRKLRPRIQMVFQEPYESLNPRFTVRQILDENLYLEGRLSRRQRADRVLALLDEVQLPRRLLGAYPHELTGGEQQRVAIGRALSTQPELIVLDEPTSALDIGVRVEIIRLLRQLQRDTAVSYLFISHDLSAVREIASRVAVMYLGEIVELAPNPDIFDEQLHPYGQALLTAVLLPDPTAHIQAVALSGEIPSPVHLPSGCRLHPRCPFVIDRCRVEWPSATEFGGGRVAACHRAAEFIQTRSGTDSADRTAVRSRSR